MKRVTIFALAGAMTAGLMTASTASAVTVIKNLGTISSAKTVSGTLNYVSNEKLIFKFTVDAPYNFTFDASGSGGTFPFTISSTATGSAGKYTETFGEYPVHGTIDYTLTTAVPEPASWALMIVGVGAVGASMRRRKAVAAV